MPVLYNIFSKTKDKMPKINSVKIIVDNREKNSLVASELIHLGHEVEFKQLEVGDYLIGEVIIERKTVSDFISSMLNKRLIIQLQNLQEVKEKLLVIEGIEEKELYNDNGEGVNPNAIRGMILSILLKYKIPIVFSKDYIDTAKFINILARKQERETSVIAKRKSSDYKEQIQYILEGFPGIGPKNAKKLLQEFKTIKNIINAPQEDLEKIIGKKAEIFKLTSRDY